MIGFTHVWNLVHMALAILGIHVAFNGKLGFWVMGTQAIVFCISAVLVAPTVVGFLGPKWALVASSGCYVVLMVSTIFPSFYTMIPAAVIMGAGAGVLWTSQGVYLTYAAANYAVENSQRRDSAMGYFNGLFFGVFQGNMVIGSIIASGLMTLLQDKNGDVPPRVITWLLYVYIGIAALSTVGAGFLSHEAPPRDASDIVPKRKTVAQTLLSFFLLLGDKRILLMIACILYSGVEQGFIFVNFTGDIVKPLLGVRNIGWVMAVFGAVNVASSIAFGKLTEMRGPSIVVIIGWISHVAFLITYFLFYVYLLTFLGVGVQLLPVTWIAENHWFIYVSVGVYSIGDAAWQFFPATMIGTLFTDDAEAGFANLKFWQSLGNTLMSIFGAYLLIEYKIMVSFVTLSIGIICLVVLNTYVARIDGNKRLNETSINHKLETTELLYS